MDTVLLIARLILSGVFIVSGVAKFLDREGSKAGLTAFGVPDVLANPGAVLLPLAELVLALALLPNISAWYGAAGLTGMLVIFTSGIGYNVVRGNEVNCHCFGQMSKAPVSWKTLVRNGALLAIAVFITFGGWGGWTDSSKIGKSLGSLGSMGENETMQWVALIVAAVALVGVGVQTWLVVHILGQNGRLLIRLDELEAAIAEGGAFIPQMDEDNVIDAPEQHQGLPLGSDAPNFKLEGIYGETMTLSALRAKGNPVMLIFSDPSCGPCNALLPELADWQRDHASKLTVALVSRGAVDVNQAKAKEHGVSNILLQQDREVAGSYEAPATPTGVLIDVDGKIASANAPGADAIRRIVERVVGGGAAPQAAAPAAAAPARPAATAANGNGNGNGQADQPNRPAPASSVGKAAPAIALADLDGKNVSLNDFKGSNTVVMFWNPGCGFCKRMVDDIKAWENAPQANAPKLLLVSTGTAESNRELGLKSPTLLDQGFNAGRSFGASGTPSAVLVDANGNIASNVAVGQPSVMGLLKGEDPAKVAPPPAANNQPQKPAGVAKGKPAPDVKLKDLNGQDWDLKINKGKDTLLVFWNPGCGFCRKMVDEIKGWETAKPGNAPDMILVSTGTAESNKALGLNSRTLLDDGFSVGRKFGATGTPSAILIDKNGNVASEVQVGGPNVMALAGAAKV